MSTKGRPSPLVRMLKAEQLVADLDAANVASGYSFTRVQYLDRADRKFKDSIMFGALALFASPLFFLPLYDLYTGQGGVPTMFFGAAVMGAGVASMLILSLRARRESRVLNVLARMS